MKRIILLITIASTVFGCGSAQKQNARIVIDSTRGDDDLPAWTRDGRKSWKDDERIYIKGNYTIRGDQRLNSCFELARLEAKETMLAEIKTNVKSELNTASEGLSESNDLFLNKSSTEESSGIISGFKMNEQYFERYLVNQTERIDCFVLGSISLQDYEKVKNKSQELNSAVAKEVSDVIRKKQMEFFSEAEQ